MALRGRMKLASYDRLFPSQDLLPSGGVGNLIAAPLFKPARDEGRTVFIDPGRWNPTRTGVLAATLAGRAPGYTSPGFSDARRIPPTPSTTGAGQRSPVLEPASRSAMPGP